MLWDNHPVTNVSLLDALIGDHRPFLFVATEASRHSHDDGIRVFSPMTPLVLRHAYGPAQNPSHCCSGEGFVLWECNYLHNEVATPLGRRLIHTPGFRLRWTVPIA